MPVTVKDVEDFGRFAVEQLEHRRAKSLKEHVVEWNKLQRWNERNALSAEQSRQGLCKPLVGQGVGMLCLIPLGVVWIVWAARFRRERDQRRQA